MLAEVAANKARRLRSWDEALLLTWTSTGVTVVVSLAIRYLAGVRELLPVAIFEAVVGIIAAVAWIRVRRALLALEKFL